VASWVAAAPLLHLSAGDPVFLGLAVAGSLLPDLDHPKSWVGRRVWPLSRIIAAILGHRGITHSAIAVAGMAALLLYAGTREAWVDALVVGYLSHLAADLLTPRGLRLAWPLPGRWALPICRTGSPAEPLIVLLLLAGLGWWMLHGR
jgi:inner membrane protein